MMKGHLIKYLFVISLFLYIGCVSAADTQQFQQSGTTVQESTEDWGQIRLDGGYVLINNVWNKGAASGQYKQRVFQETINGGAAFGWQWQWSSSLYVAAYPEVVYGDKPWDQPLKLVAQLPFTAGSKNVTANFNIMLNASGVYNMAFSLWAITDPDNPKSSITHEIMIWNVNHGDASGGNSNTWIYIAFVARKPFLNGPLDMSTFIQYLLNKQILTTNHYITSIELGNELIRGKGIVEISNYSITIE